MVVVNVFGVVKGVEESVSGDGFLDAAHLDSSLNAWQWKPDYKARMGVLLSGGYYV